MPKLLAMGKRWELYLLVFLSLFILSSCQNAYKEHFWSYHGTQSWQSQRGSSYSGTPEDILILPDASIHDLLIQRMWWARKRIWVEIYTWTDKKLAYALIDAKQRWLDVRVILEPNVFGSPNINKPIYELFMGKGIDVTYSNTYKFRFTHAKFFLLDDDVYISTGNFTRSFFEKNRDIIIRIWSGWEQRYLENLFLRDFSHLGTENLAIPENLVVSPIDSRSKILALIDSARSSIVIYTQNLQDSDIWGLLTQKALSGIKVQVCTAKNESNELSLNQDWPFDWTLVTKPYPHLKTILIDGQILFIGSQNLTQNSLDNNREVGIIIEKNPQVIRKVSDLYKKDCLR